MIRTMGDATGSSSGSIPRTVDLIAPYITGLGSVPWSDADLAAWSGYPQATIDQGAGASPRFDANIIDIETGAYSVNQVTTWMNRATAPRPTVYVNRGNEQAACLAALASPRFRGDVWLAFPGWQPGQPLPGLPDGCRYVAIQNVFTSNYDLSSVIDDSWPLEAPVNLNLSTQDGWAYCGKCQGLFFAAQSTTSGVCPAGGAHDSSKGSYDYSLPHSVTTS